MSSTSSSQQTRTIGTRAARATTCTMVALGVLAGGLTVTQDAWGSALALVRLPAHQQTAEITATVPATADAVRVGARPAVVDRCAVRVVRHQRHATWGMAHCRNLGTGATWTTPVRLEGGRLVPVSVDDLPWDLRALVRRLPSAVVPAAPNAMASRAKASGSPRALVSAHAHTGAAQQH